MRRVIEGVGDGVRVTNGKSKNAAQYVEHGQQDVEVFLAHRPSDEEGGVNESEIAGVAQKLRFLVVNGKSVSGAVHDANELRNGKEKVDELRNEEEHESLGEVTLDGRYSQSHSRKISKTIAHKGLRWECIIIGQR